MKIPPLLWLLAGAFLGSTVLPLHADQASRVAESPSAGGETPAQHDARMQWWREARFGLFIHWGIYSVPAGTWHGRQIVGLGEWIQNRGKIPVADYARFAEEFNPVKFDADAWVKLARDAGMKYIVITSKHHDGFAMFKSEASSFNIVDATPFKHDPIKDIAAACQKYGIKLGLYYSQAQDWHHAGGAARGGHWDPAQDGDMDEYLKKIAVPQVKEILTHYGPIAVLWWDTPDNMTKERADLLAPLLKLQPDIITNNRLGEGHPGDTETPEQRIPATGYPRDWESCMTINDTWGYKSYDHNWKSAETLIRNLVDIVSKGGNYLLNVGPTSEGEIPAPSIERLHTIGAWLQRNGEAIYATKASPFKRLAWGRATQKPGKLYLHVFNWPADGRLTVPMSSSAQKAYLLADPQTPVKFTSSPAGLQLQLPGTAPDPIVSVVVLEGVGTVAALPPPPITQAANQPLELTSDAADLSGKSIRVEGNTQLNLGAWHGRDDFAQWHVEITTPGTYDVAINYSSNEAEAGGKFAISVGDQSVEGKVADTAGTYKSVSIGELQLSKPGPLEITLKAVDIPGNELMKFRSITLTPEKTL